MKLKNRLIIKIFIGIVVLIFISCNTNSDSNKGLIGIYYSEPNLTSIKALTVLESLEQIWDESVDFQGGSSGEWNGYIIAPIDGLVTFHFTTDQIAKVIIKDDSLKLGKENPAGKLIVNMKKGESYPITLFFWHPGQHADYGSFSLKWSWENNEVQSIPLSNIYYTEKETNKLAFLKDLETAALDKSQVIYARVKNVIVYHEPDRFAAWPANSGIWIWEDEILVGFLRAWNKENKYHHAIDKTMPSNRAFARSKDGGLSWSYEEASEKFSYAAKANFFKGKLNYKANGFALLNRNQNFFYSYNKGASWYGPFAYPDLRIGEMTSRTDYIAESSDECLIFASVKDARVRASLQDHAVCIRTGDGGKTFEFVGWMSELDSIRSVMPATVKINQNHFISAMRRRLDPTLDDKHGLAQNWIDVYESLDQGKKWKFLAKIANTDQGIRNGNPPSMVRLENGFLCVVYGYRGIPYSIRSRVSKDNGKTWSKEIILRDDARIWDIGYLRSVVRKDGNVVSVYYFSTEERTERHIAATIWDPGEITHSE